MSYMNRLCAMSYNNKKGQNEFWKNPCYSSYVEKHGHHMSKPLAKWASMHLKNATGDNHRWTCDEVESAMTQLGLKLPAHKTIGDATYIANMSYANLYGVVAQSDREVLQHAYAILNSPNAYDGDIFTRFTADIMAKGIDINWSEVM